MAFSKVEINNETYGHETFITIGYNKDSGDLNLLMNADLTLVAASMEILHKEFEKRYEALSEADQADFVKSLEGGVVL